LNIALKSVKYLLVVFCCVFWSTSNAQVITIKDSLTRLPIENVFLFSGEVSALSNAKGKIDLSEFRASDSIVFQHPSYLRTALLKSDLSMGEQTVSLKESILKLDGLVIVAKRFEHEKKEVPN